MRAYWDGLNERERWMLGVGVVCAVCYALYLLIYAPLIRAVHRQSQRVVEQQETLAWMRQVQVPFQAKKAQKKVTSTKLLTVLSKQLESTSFQRFPYQLQQVSGGDIQLVFPEVPLSPFLVWLQSIHEAYAITIKQWDAERTKVPGVVKLTVLIAA